MPDDIRFVSKVGRDAWLRVKLANGQEQSLPYALKVRFIARTNQRDQFEILEGVLKGQRASVLQKNVSESYLVKDGIVHMPGARVRFDRARQALWFGSYGPVSAFSGEFDRYTQVPPGEYLLQIPFAPSDKTRTEYYTYTDYHKTWFRLGLSPQGSRFLHCGEISEGCITTRAFLFDPSIPAASQPPGFSDLPRLPHGAVGLPYPATRVPVGSWTAIYEYLMVSRQDDQSVGKVTVL